MKKTISRILDILLVLLVLIAAFAPAVPVYAGETSKIDELNALFTTADLMDATVAELLEAMESRRLTSVQLTQMYLDRIEAYDDALELNSILALNPNALREAAAMDAMRRSGRLLGRLHGIPILVKDNIDVVGMATTAGSLTLKDAIADDDSEVVARLRAEGAVILGKTNMSEFAEIGYNSRSEVGGITHNAYDLIRTPAGSSGGTAVAITCNFAAIGLGTDTGSSIRRPSSFANIYGLRPSFGLVSHDGLYPLNYNKDMIGPMCRTTEDLALLLDIIAGSDEKDVKTAGADQYLPEDGYTAYLNADGLRGKRIGYLANSFGYYYDYNDQALSNPTPLDDKIVGMVDRFRETLISGGAELVDLSGILPESMIASYSYDETISGMLRFREAVTKLLEENRIDAVLYISQVDVAEIEIYAEGWKNNDAYYIAEFGPLAGLPDIVLPMGFSETDPENGYDYPMPLGACLFAGYGQDAVLLEIAYAYEQLTSVREQPWTTPALPDASLADFAEELLAEVGVLRFSDYTEESAAALQLAAEYLQGLCMEGADISGTETAVSVTEYQAAVRELALAYDALDPYVPPTTSEPAEEVFQPTVAETVTAAEKEQEGSITPAVTIAVALMVALTVVVGIAVAARYQ